MTEGVKRLEPYRDAQTHREYQKQNTHREYSRAVAEDCGHQSVVVLDEGRGEGEGGQGWLPTALPLNTHVVGDVGPLP